MRRRRRRPPLPVEAGPPPPRGAPCAAWSGHAAELATGLASELELWPETPTTAVLVAEGYLQRIMPGIFLPPGRPANAVSRALALGCAIGDRLRSHQVIAGTSAAWVLLGGPPPAPAELLSTAHRETVPGVLVRHARLRAHEVETIGGAPVTVPLRTAVDLLRFAPEQEAVSLVARLIATGHVQEEVIVRALSRMDRHPGARIAERRLQEVTTGLAGAGRPAAA